MKSILLGLALLAATAAANPVIINQPTTRLYQSGFGSSPTGSVTMSVSNQVGFGGTLSATACFDGYCPGQAIPGAGPDFFVNDPLTLKVTDLTYTCNPLSLYCTGNLGAFFDWFDVDLANVNVPVTLSVDGTALNGIDLSFLVEWESCDLIGNNCEGHNTFSLAPTFNGNTFSSSFNLGSLTFQGQTHFELDVTFNFVPGGETVTMPGSMTVTLGSAGAAASPAPEPGTISIALAGLSLLAIHQRLRNSRRHP